MSDEDLSVAVWLPTEPDELAFLQNTLRNAGILVPGNYSGDDPYLLVEYLVAATVKDCEFRALFDRNLISPLVALASGDTVPESLQAQSNARLAAACACFCILARILIEPNISLYEYASTSGNDAAQSDAHRFRVADNSDAMAYLDIALERADCLPQELLDHVHSLPEIEEHTVPEKDFERTLNLWKPNYLHVLKTVALRRSGLSPSDTAAALTRWQAEYACFNAPGGMYCLAAIAHAPPKGRMLKGILSKNRAALRAGVRNATWDICLLQEFGRHVRKSTGALWSLWSADVAVREVAKSLFVGGNESEEDKLNHFYQHHWGKKDGPRLLAEYREAASAADIDSDSRQVLRKEAFSRIDENIQELELELGISDA